MSAPTIARMRARLNSAQAELDRERRRRERQVERLLGELADERTEVERLQAALSKGGDAVDGSRQADSAPAVMSERGAGESGSPLTNCVFCGRRRATQADWDRNGELNDDQAKAAGLDDLCWEEEDESCLALLAESDRPSSLKEALEGLPSQPSPESGSEEKRRAEAEALALEDAANSVYEPTGIDAKEALDAILAKLAPHDIATAQPQPESGSEESEWDKLMNAPIQRPGKVYVQHDNDAQTGEWMDGRQVNALVRSLKAKLPQPESGSGEEGARAEAEKWKITSGAHCEVLIRAEEVLLDRFDGLNADDKCEDLARRLNEFDAWLSFRSEFGEVLVAFRSAFGTDTSETEKAAPTQPLQGPQATQLDTDPESSSFEPGTGHLAGSQVERWAAFGDGSHDPREDGEWVCFTDYTALQAQLQRVEEERDEARERVTVIRHQTVARLCAERDQANTRATQAEAQIEDAAKEFERQASELRRRHDIEPVGPPWMIERAEVWEKAANYLRKKHLREKQAVGSGAGGPSTDDALAFGVAPGVFTASAAPSDPAPSPEVGENWPALWAIRRCDGTGAVNLYGGDPTKHVRNTYEIQRYVPAPQPQVREKQLEEALKWYGDKSNYTAQNPPGRGSPIWRDAGELARAALEGKDGPA